MSNPTQSFDVFLSYAITDSHVANEVAKAFEAANLSTFGLRDIATGQDISKILWEAMAESRALVMIVSPNNNLSHAMGLVEIGAASAWNKPIYILVNGPSTVNLSLPIQTCQTFPLSRLDELIREVKRGMARLTEEELAVLVDVHLGLNIPVDQYFHTHKLLQALTEQFYHRTQKQISGERLLSELLRLRKLGKLRKHKTPA